jgi:uncharacterized RDD family membrane protein YckC
MSYNVLDDEFKKVPQTYEFATFGDRVKASVIDTLVFIPFIFMTIYNWTDLKIYELDLFLNAAMIMYKPIMEWHYGATIGKMVAKIKVVNQELSEITLDQSFRRFAVYFIGYGISLMASYALFQDPDFASATTLVEVGDLQAKSPLNDFSQMASFLVLVSVTFVAFDLKRQALHDKLAETYCIKVP